MSLSKQLLILISVLFLLIFSLNFVLSVNNIRDYLEGEAEIHAQDTATSLGVSLSPYLVDEKDPLIKTTMSAIFDMGYYQEITLRNIDKQVLVTLTNNDKIEGVPDWFINLIEMKAASVESEISSGWTISGVVSVKINPGYGYLKLYQQAKSGFYYSLATFFVSIVLLLMVLRITLSSIKKIEQVAVTIAEGKFETIEPLPWTTEVRNVAVSINLMSRKIEAAIKTLNGKLNNLGKKLQQDDLTGLNKKSSFETDIKSLFSENNDAFIFMIKADGLGSLVKEMGSDAIDQFLKDFATMLNRLAEQNQARDISVYRFVGSEFVLLLKQSNQKQAVDFAEKLSAALADIALRYQKTDIAHIGVTAFNPLETTEKMLLAANEAYQQAQLIGANSFYIRQSEDHAKGIAEWKSLVFNSIDNQQYQLSYIGQVKSFENQQLMMEEAFTQVEDNQGEKVSIGTFVSIAEKFEKIVDLDKGVTAKVIDHIKDNAIQHAIEINLSTRTVKSSDFRAWLVNVVKQHQAMSEQLVFSFSAYAVAKDFAMYKEFIVFVHQLKAKIIIKRFEAQSISLPMVKELKPDYIRLCRELSNDMAMDDGKKAFVEAMQEMGGLLDISILAENVQNEGDFSCLQKIGVAGASR